MKTRVGLIVMLIGVGLLAVGCGDDDEVATTTTLTTTTTSSTTTPTTTTSTSTTTTTVPGANTRYESVFDLRDLVEGTGFECDKWEVLAQPTNAVERAECSGDVVLSIHENASQAQLSVEGVEAVVTEYGLVSVHLVGPNWSVNCGRDEGRCERFQVALGGELSVAEPDPDATDVDNPLLPPTGIDVVERIRAQAIILDTIFEAGGDIDVAFGEIMEDDQRAALSAMDTDNLGAYREKLADLFHPEEGDILPDYASDEGTLRALLAAIEACGSMGAEAPMEMTIRRVFATYNIPTDTIEKAEFTLGVGVIASASVLLCPDLSPPGDELAELLSAGLDQIRLNP